VHEQSFARATRKRDDWPLPSSEGLEQLVAILVIACIVSSKDPCVNSMCYCRSVVDPSVIPKFLMEATHPMPDVGLVLTMMAIFCS